MFTGLIEETGEILLIEDVEGGRSFTIGASRVLRDAEIGDSIAVNGCCLTLTARTEHTWTTMAMVETIQRTALGRSKVGQRLNLERPTAVGGRLGGHIVQGHVDTTTEVVARHIEADGSVRVRLALPGSIRNYVVEKGSITVDGVSLTVAAVDPGAQRRWFEVALIPHTLDATTLGELVPGAMVNVEADSIAKHLEALTTPYRAEPEPRAAGHTVLADIPAALDVIRNGGIVVVVDDEDRENEGDLIMSAQLATAESMAFFVRHTSGVICCGVDEATADRLELPLMVEDNTEAMGTAFTVTVDAVAGTTTGISAADRATTLRHLADPATTPSELARPGHIFPLRSRPDGVLEREGHTEAAVDLARLAGLAPAGVLCEIVNDDGTMSRLPDLVTFAKTHGLLIISIADLVTYRHAAEPAAERPPATATLPTPWGPLVAHGHIDPRTGAEHVALVLGNPQTHDHPLVRIHSECLTGDLFGSTRCDCGSQLHSALDAMADRGAGVVLYLRGQEGRGIGLVNKLRAYALQEQGRDTVDANLELGLPVDARDYAAAATMLHRLGIQDIELLTNNPAKSDALGAGGIRVHRVTEATGHRTEENAAYLHTKHTRMGHLTTVGHRS